MCQNLLNSLRRIDGTQSFQDVPPGKYRLIIETAEAASLQTATLQTDLEFTE
jgi:hypothetical protein